MLLTYGPVARHSAVGGCSTQGQMASFLALACPGHLHTQPRWGLQGRLLGQPQQLLRPGSRHQAAICWGGAKTGDPGARRSGTGFTSFLELEVPHWNADGCGYGPVCSGRQGGLPVPILCPWWERTKRTCLLDFFPQPVLSSRGSKASPAHFLQEACVLAPHPQPLPQPRLIWDPGSGGLDPLHRSCCTMPGR